MKEIKYDDGYELYAEDLKIAFQVVKRLELTKATQCRVEKAMKKLMVDVMEYDLFEGNQNGK